MSSGAAIPLSQVGNMYVMSGDLVRLMTTKAIIEKLTIEELQKLSFEIGTELQEREVKLNHKLGG
jgi:hypothetical protein